MAASESLANAESYKPKRKSKLIPLNLLQLLLLLLLTQLRCIDSSSNSSSSSSGSSSSGSISSNAAAANCSKGFELQNGSCTDIDECQLVRVLGNNRVDVCGNYLTTSRRGFRCINTKGSYRCHRIADCGFGYNLNYTTGNCDDINECEVLGKSRACGGSVAKVCVNQPGTFRCDFKRCPSNQHLDRVTGKCRRCPSGFQLVRGGVCEDVDECAHSHLHKCDTHMQCVNYAGTYECRHKIFCKMGMKPDLYGNKCIDIDECAQSKLMCYFGWDCINTVGSFKCVPKRCSRFEILNQNGECLCKEGFYRSNNTTKCIDRNECTEGLHQCNFTEICRNTLGGYACLPENTVCNPGFALNFDLLRCVDIDECSLNSFRCNENEHCVNTHGSYECQCDAGFERIGNQCKDVNECSTMVKACPETFDCVNNIGNYTCQCQKGLVQINETCEDENECEFKADTCGPGSCQNKYAGYDCLCPIGYASVDNPPACRDVDECKLGRYCNGRECINTDGSFYCECRNGYRWNATDVACTDIDECMEETAKCSGKQCINYKGGYFCYSDSCPANFNFIESGTDSYGKYHITCESRPECSSIKVGDEELCAKKWKKEKFSLTLKEENKQITLFSYYAAQFERCELGAASINYLNGSHFQLDKAQLNERFKVENISVGTQFTQCKVSVKKEDFQFVDTSKFSVTVIVNERKTYDSVWVKDIYIVYHN